MPAITSREYKIILQAQALADRSAAVAKLWHVVQTLATTQNLEIRGSLSEEVERQVSFWDTANHDLLDQGYVVRRRSEVKAGQPVKTKVMLKFRSPDLYISAGVDVTSPLAKSETKFEEDIVPAFRSQYAHSTSAEVPVTSQWPSIGDLAKDFPGLLSLNLPNQTPLKVVNDFVGQEFVNRGAVIDFGKHDAAVALTTWYTPSIGPNKPAIAEFSFTYAEPLGNFSAKSAKRAKTFFESLQTLTDWYAPQAITKTQFVYQYKPA